MFDALIDSAHRSTVSTSVHDQVQIALAIADESVLKSLLVNATPAIGLPHLIGSVRVAIGVPIPAHKAADAVIHFEQVRTVLIDSPDEVEQHVQKGDRDSVYRQYAKLTRCESDTQTLGHGVSLAQAIALLNHAGFSQTQIDDIVNLPYDASYKSWWYAIDPDGNVSLPFHRTMRTLRYPDGTLTLQYKDQFADVKPACFKGAEVPVLVEIQTESRSFGKIIEKINIAREKLAIDRAILISNQVSDYEVQGYNSQGISIHTTQALSKSARVSCKTCTTPTCPLHGLKNSPVLNCRQFSAL